MFELTRLKLLLSKRVGADCNRSRDRGVEVLARRASMEQENMEEELTQ